MIQFKKCPKCHGDLYLTEDIHGAFFSCLQCGYLRDLALEAPVATLVPKPYQIDTVPKKSITRKSIAKKPVTKKRDQTAVAQAA